MAKATQIEKVQVDQTPAPVSPPKTRLMPREFRALMDMASVPLSLTRSWLTRGAVNQSMENESRKYPVIMLPGFASDDRYLKPLAKHLSHLGYLAEGWGLGTNLAGADKPHTLDQLSPTWNVEPYDGYTPEEYRGEGGVPLLCDLATARVRERAAELGGPVTLIGWSLGGYIAREVARELGDDVAHVITLGAPVIGGPKYTKAARVFEAKGFDMDWIEREAGKRDTNPIQQPITAIYSKTDAVVDWRAAIDRVSPNVTHWQINAPHLGMGFNAQIWRLIRKSLKEYGQKPD